MRFVSFLVLLIAGCGGAAHARRAQAIGGQAPPPHTARAPAAEPRTSAVDTAVSPPAQVETADTRPALEVIEGRVSYYADSLSGHSTATGEPYDPTALTAASRDLPFGTMVRVVRIDTGASVVVRINDRGPFGRRTRILDLSRAAAEALDMIQAGVIEVRAEILERGAGRH